LRRAGNWHCREFGLGAGSQVGRAAPKVLEAFNMEIVYFIMFVAACAVVLMWAAGKSGKKRKEQAKTQTLRAKAPGKKPQADLLNTPSSYLLSNSGDVWRQKRQKAAEDVIVTNRFVPKSVSAGEPEYDGFSRRDRHHVVVGTAHIKKEDHIDEPAAHSKENKAAG